MLGGPEDHRCGTAVARSGSARDSRAGIGDPPIRTLHPALNERTAPTHLRHASVFSSANRRLRQTRNMPKPDDRSARKGPAFNALPDDEKQHYYRCAECGKLVDMRHLDEVLFHEDHKHQPDIPYGGSARLGS